MPCPVFRDRRMAIKAWAGGGGARLPGDWVTACVTRMIAVACRVLGTKKGPTPHQAFLGHSAAVTGTVQLGDTLVTADAGDCLLFWKCSNSLTHPPSRSIGAAPLDTCTAPRDASFTNGSKEHPEDAVIPQELRLSRVVPEPHATLRGAHDAGPLSGLYGSLPGLPRGTSNEVLVGSTAPRLVCDSVIGMSHVARNTMLWLPPQGLLLYAVDNTVVVDDLHSRRQRYLVLNRCPVTSLASVAPNSPIIAAASECSPLHSLFCTSLSHSTWDDCSYNVLLASQPCCTGASSFLKGTQWSSAVGKAAQALRLLTSASGTRLPAPAARCFPTTPLPCKPSRSAPPAAGWRALAATLSDRLSSGTFSEGKPSLWVAQRSRWRRWRGVRALRQQSL
jgi:hypothetical protein